MLSHEGERIDREAVDAVDRTGVEAPRSQVSVSSNTASAWADSTGLDNALASSS